MNQEIREEAIRLADSRRSTSAATAITAAARARCLAVIA